ncbi:hypothetical protein Q6348_05015 [Isoptericola sp. b441]|uniref:Cardiolipin synthase N-terminal domain-containing protein n=1 Tax=Actinotalea lenta TaxID=3064654 RepID=A0ABT9D8H5_9CELL|nr:MULTISPECIES: hypothetical protein [unclassified Isoptericola]MDO8106554.1 hypothetical protein [Isoptericola sp. b441]MDO8121738.1 hypothetical protein [Isoptericola sp. b490]
MPKSWKDLSPRTRTALVVLGSAQLALAATAWTDLAARPAKNLRGPKPWWAAVIAVALVGPAAYAVCGVHGCRISPIP